MNSFDFGKIKRKTFRKQQKSFKYIMVSFLISVLIIALPTDYAKQNKTEACFSDIESQTESVSENFGYFNGEWNFWEYIGDYFAQFLEK